MIWLTWRQHRLQALGGLLLVAVTALVFLPYGHTIRNDYTALGVGTCLARGTGGDHCQSALSGFVSQFNGIANHLLTWFTPVPGLIGAIVGASLLAREYEQGTWRLAWTQAVPRTRWLAVKMLLVSAGIVVVTTSLSAIFGWFRGPIDRVSSPFSPGAFDLEGLSLTGYTLFAFAAGTLAGLLARRTVPAIVAALAAFMAVRLSVEFWLRQRYETPATRLLPPPSRSTIGPMAVPTTPGRPGWILSNHLADRTGHTLSAARQEQLSQAAQATADPAGYLRGLGIRLQIVYQPADRFWTFQIIEAALFTSFATALAAITVYLLRRRNT